MNEYDGFSTYDGDAEHDMNVDYDYHINTGQLDYIFDEPNPDDFDDWD